MRFIKNGRRIGSCRDLCGGIFAASCAWGFVSGKANSGSEDGKGESLQWKEKVNKQDLTPSFDPIL